MEANNNPSPEPSKKANGAEVLRRWQGLSSDLAPWKPEWQRIADVMMPRKAGISQTTDTPSTAKDSTLFDTTAIDASLTMAGGLMSWTSPANEVWFTFKPPFELRGSDVAVEWYATASERIREMLALSNYYTEAHEDLLNHCVFATSALYVGMEEGRYRFESLPLGTFAIAENNRGEVDTLFRELEYTARQAKLEFGEESLPKEVRDCLTDEKKELTKHKFIHAVYPRENRPEGIAKQAAWGKAWASVYVCYKSKEVVKESGYSSFPFAVGRYLKWNALGPRTPYGYGPGFAALPDTNMLNFLQMMLDCAAEKIVRPAMLAPAEMDGDLILSAGGITYMAEGIGTDRWPRAIPQVGDYNVAVDRVKMRQESVNMKFHVELFRMFASIERQMTAYEVAERAAEKITLISPAFSRLQSEKHNPILRRLFSLALENGLLEPPPEEVVIPMDGGKMGMVPDPDISYSSRLALALDQLKLNGFDRQLARISQLAAVRPDVFDDYNFSQMNRDTARINGVPEGWILPIEEVQAMQQARAQQQQAAMTAQMVGTGAKAVRDVGGMEAAKEMISELS